MPECSRRFFFQLFLLALLSPTVQAAQPQPLEFHVTFDPTITARGFTGRVYLVLSETGREPRLGINWFAPEPCFAQDVQHWTPGKPLIFRRGVLGYPVALDRLKKTTWTVQAVMDLNRGGRHYGTSPGNGFSKPLRRELDPAQSGVVRLHIDQIAQATAFPETERVKLVDIESKLLTRFHHRSVRLRAGVVLPASWSQQPQRRYGAVYEIPGFGGTHFGAFAEAARNASRIGDTEALWVVLDPECPLGHHVFADSANNGPVGQALVEELIPAIEARFRGPQRPEGRLLTGHSSGGWSSLWLQITYPDFFAGTWSTAPDPVDFRDFQQINLYQKGANLFTDERGQPRPIARRGGKPLLFYKAFSDMEVLMGRGGQLASFEAVFSPRGEDGRPLPLWDRATGQVNPAVAKSWEKYDIRLILERNWKTLGPKLRGKVHVFMGDQDTFYLEGATRLLQQSLARLGSDAMVELFPGRDHGNLVDRALSERITRQMAAQLKRFENSVQR